MFKFLMTQLGKDVLYNLEQSPTSWEVNRYNSTEIVQEINSIRIELFYKDSHRIYRISIKGNDPYTLNYFDKRYIGKATKKIILNKSIKSNTVKRADLNPEAFV